MLVKEYFENNKIVNTIDFNVSIEDLGTEIFRSRFKDHWLWSYFSTEGKFFGTENRQWEEGEDNFFSLLEEEPLHGVLTDEDDYKLVITFNENGELTGEYCFCC